MSGVGRQVRHVDPEADHRRLVTHGVEAGQQMAIGVCLPHVGPDERGARVERWVTRRVNVRQQRVQSRDLMTGIRQLAHDV